MQLSSFRLAKMELEFDVTISCNSKSCRLLPVVVAEVFPASFSYVCPFVVCVNQMYAEICTLLCLVSKRCLVQMMKGPLRERERERERETDRQTDRQRQRDRDRQTDRQTDRHRQRQRNNKMLNQAAVDNTIALVHDFVSGRK